MGGDEAHTGRPDRRALGAFPLRRIAIPCGCHSVQGQIVSRSLSIAIGPASLPAITAGPDDGIPVIFLHAGVCDHRMWANQVEAVAAAGYRAVAYTRRGFGDATSPDEPFSQLDDLEALLEQ